MKHVFDFPFRLKVCPRGVSIDYMSTGFVPNAMGVAGAATSRDLKERAAHSSLLHSAENSPNSVSPSFMWNGGATCVWTAMGEPVGNGLMGRELGGRRRDDAVVA